MKRIKILKIGNSIREEIESETLDKDGNIISNIPTDIEEFRTIAIDTVNWVIGHNVKRALSDSNVNMSASNAKGVILLSKLISPTEEQLTNLTYTERESWEAMKALADNGYSDSELLKYSLTTVSIEISNATSKIIAITNATTIDEMIDVLNTL